MTLKAVASKTKNEFVMLAFFLSSAAMFFIGLGGAYIVINAVTKIQLTKEFVKIITFNTFVILASSITMFFAQKNAKSKQTIFLIVPLFMTLLLGLIFLTLQVYAWRLLQIMGETLETPFGAVFFLIAGAHFLHLLGGIIFLVLVAIRVKKEDYRKGHITYYMAEDTKEDATSLQVCGIYWHFMDLVWVILYLFLIFGNY